MSRTLFVSYQTEEWDDNEIRRAVDDISHAVDEQIVFTPDTFDFLSESEVEEMVEQLIEALD
jgi:LmbE family N-acetylglucosaminyl deacetylase